MTCEKGFETTECLVEPAISLPVRPLNFGPSVPKVEAAKARRHG